MTQKIVPAASPPTLAKNARMGHPLFRNGKEKPGAWATRQVNDPGMIPGMLGPGDLILFGGVRTPTWLTEGLGKALSSIFGKAAEESAEKGIEIVAQDGTKITGYTEHAVNRAIGDTAERAGTKAQSILDALKNPRKIVSGVDSQGRPFKIFTGQTARVIVNPQTGNIVSVNPLSGAGVR
jgi:hypothetical protein